ncbi:hypothetical protein N320_06469, partial [Buceros rhinoceros silvestris]
RPLLHHRVDSNFSYLKEGIWPLGGETWFVLATQNSVRQRELDFRILQEKYGTHWPMKCYSTYMELLDCWSTALASSNLLNFHDLNRVSTGTMASSHVAVCNNRT